MIYDVILCWSTDRLMGLWFSVSQFGKRSVGNTEIKQLYDKITWEYVTLTLWESIGLMGDYSALSGQITFMEMQQ